MPACMAYSAPLAVAIALIISFALFVNQHSKLSSPVHLKRQTHRIPRLIHQTWIDNNVPETYAPWRASWLGLQPQWTYRLWTDLDNDQLVTSKFRWFRPTYDRLPVKIMKVDAVRYMYVFRWWVCGCRDATAHLYAQVPVHIWWHLCRPRYAPCQTHRVPAGKPNAGPGHIIQRHRI